MMPWLKSSISDMIPTVSAVTAPTPVGVASPGWPTLDRVPGEPNDLTPRDILGNFVAAGGPAVSPDGGRVVYAVRRIDLEANRYRSQLWIAPTDASAPPRPLTDGAKGDSDPAWSPDGRLLAFVSHRGDKEGDTTLHVLAADGPGETATIATMPDGISGPVWSPDGQWIAFGSRHARQALRRGRPAKADATHDHPLLQPARQHRLDVRPPAAHLRRAGRWHGARRQPHPWRVRLRRALLAGRLLRCDRLRAGARDMGPRHRRRPLRDPARRAAPLADGQHWVLRFPIGEPGRHARGLPRLRRSVDVAAEHPRGSARIGERRTALDQQGPRPDVRAGERIPGTGLGRRRRPRARGGPGRRQRVPHRDRRRRDPATGDTGRGDRLVPHGRRRPRLRPYGARPPVRGLGPSRRSGQRHTACRW